jgi:hypothetical protein
MSASASPPPAQRITLAEARDVQIVALYDRAIADLREARTIEEVQRIGAIAEAMAAYARKLRAAMQAQNAAEKVVLLAEQRIGAELKAAQERGEVATRADGTAIRDHVPDGNKVAPATLPDLGLTRKRAAEAKALAALGENAITEATEEATKTGKRLSKRELLRRARAAKQPPTTAAPRRQAQRRRAQGCAGARRGCDASEGRREHPARCSQREHRASDPPRPGHPAPARDGRGADQAPVRGGGAQAAGSGQAGGRPRQLGRRNARNHRAPEVSR